MYRHASNTTVYPCSQQFLFCFVNHNFHKGCGFTVTFNKGERNNMDMTCRRKKNPQKTAKTVQMNAGSIRYNLRGKKTPLLKTGWLIKDSQVFSLPRSRSLVVGRCEGCHRCHHRHRGKIGLDAATCHWEGCHTPTQATVHKSKLGLQVLAYQTLYFFLSNMLMKHANPPHSKTP